MYLPTFWKLTAEANLYRGKHMAGWLLPAGLMVAWIGFPSFYNWTYSTIIPPPKGVAKRNWLESTYYLNAYTPYIFYHSTVIILNY
jgi:hypothetical protein